MYLSVQGQENITADVEGSRLARVNEDDGGDYRNWGRVRHLIGKRYCTNRTAVSLRGHQRGTTSRLTGAGSLLPPVYSEAWAKGNAKVSPEHHFPPYGTPHTANMRVVKPTVLVKNK
ncbi:hypothetical protein TNCV_3983041 [Trichonephila clavipes]|nr:hypothetical protein TNCV_3983041 [Trichonephila clavipes]